MISNDELTHELDPHWHPVPVWKGVDCASGWNEIILRAHRFCLECDPNYRILQIKEKFGGLRYYVEGHIDRPGLDVILDESFVTCERCGEPGQTRNSGWIRTLCDACESLRKRPELAKDTGLNPAAG